MLKFKKISFLSLFFYSFISFTQAEIPPSALSLKKIQASQKSIIKSFAKLPPSITVFGGSRPRVPEDDQIYPWAKSLSKQVALDKEIIKTGGLGGFMSAAQEGYLEGTGKDSQALDLNRWYSGSPLIKHYFATDRMTLRKWGLIHNTKLFVAFPGAMGTMDEFFETWKRKQEGSLKAPLILAGKEYWGELISALKKATLENHQILKESDFELFSIIDIGDKIKITPISSVKEKNPDIISNQDLLDMEKLIKEHDFAVISNGSSGSLGNLSQADLKKSIKNSILRMEFFLHHSRANIFYPSDLEALNYFAALVDQIQLKLTYDRPLILIGKSYWEPLLGFLKKIFKPGTMEKIILVDSMSPQELEKILSSASLPQEKSIQRLSSFYDIDFDLFLNSRDNLVIFDADETLIQPEDNYWLNEHNKDAIELKKEIVTLHPEIKSEQEWDEIMVVALKAAKRPLIEEEAARQIQRLSKHKIPVIICTGMNNSQIADLNTITWRKEQMDAVHVGPYLSKRFGKHIENFYSKSKAIYHEGVLTTDMADKGEVLGAFLDKVKFQPKQVIMFDDSIEWLKTVEQECQKRGIPFKGYEYVGAKRRPLNKDLIKKQMEILIKERKWLSDKEFSN